MLEVLGCLISRYNLCFRWTRFADGIQAANCAAIDRNVRPLGKLTTDPVARRTDPHVAKILHPFVLCPAMESTWPSSPRACIHVGTLVLASVIFAYLLSGQLRHGVLSRNPVALDTARPLAWCSYGIESPVSDWFLIYQCKYHQHSSHRLAKGPDVTYWNGAPPSPVCISDSTKIYSR